MRLFLIGRWARCPSYILALFLLATPAWAVLPDEMLADPVLEARARAISADIRCPVCQGETIDDSNAPIARDLRLIVRERLVAGDTDAQVFDFVVARFGEGVLFNPPARGANLVLWFAGPALLLAGIGVAVAAGRRRVAPEASLSPQEEAQVREILRE
ncbi:cytochrome c-type biogenesis protein [Tabrizicola sp.]|jgi:cytochrome c-type biogenesis protein CcmH|uniref:cytochrome c-type biogenesis protein n=1 Tax=Tabrizicola sp. TaxID=2005166 RepID=UPI000BCFFEA9|nr:cytochrome c-type biogenesis protein [Tabrizicola sp.]MBY0351727.1 cytochrome c-type biogenesis protein CcmH [Tabrizicola sp.]OYX17590.1 MAG: cytochrome C biogenesis protein CcdA [Rhodobacterales bacterium 32-66-9]